jgi:hypothetical protein
VSDSRNRSKAVIKSPEQQAQEIEQRRIAHEQAKRQHIEKLRNEHVQNMGKQKLSDEELLKKEQQSKKFQKKLGASQDEVNNVEQDIVKDIENENQEKQKHKKTPTLDL